MKKTIGYVLSHTHWDREWYLSFQLFRMRLVDMLDTLIPYLEQHPEFPHFTLTGRRSAWRIIWRCARIRRSGCGT